ncbi:MAG: exodeoxyribonuclease III [Coriobacteriales bacterium]|jgi:exodeoxyribonuclease-3|nr:exodeoxyribonuclease III [Coriobacteriales bacterium]
MKFISWNVNGLRANINKGFYEVFDTFDADVFALQETKLQEGQVDFAIPSSYHQIWSYAERKGYSGTAVFSKEKPLRSIHTLGLSGAADATAAAAAATADAAGATGTAGATDAAGTAASGTGILGAADAGIVDTEGRLCAVEFERYWFVCCYTPNAQDGLKRIALRLAWGEAFTRFVAELAKNKPVVICGDLNVAHNEIDLKNPGPNRGNAGFSDEERADFQALLDAGFTDSFRFLYPDLTGAYSWWSFRGNARANNTGWRIDYFLVSNDLRDNIEQASIYPEVTGSDHCPVGLEIRL